MPAQLRHKFPNQTLISESLGTGDIREARRQRDVVSGRLQEQQSVASPSNRYRFYELVRSLTEDKVRHPYSWDEPYDYDNVAKTDETLLHALTTVSGHKDQHRRYQITILEAVSIWEQRHRNTKTRDTTSKIKRAINDFLKYLNLIDIQLAEINKRQVHDYIEQMLKTYAKSTVQGHISRLRSIWNYCDSLGEVTTPSPFNGHEYSGGTEVVKKQPFTPEEVARLKELITDELPMKKLLVELAAFTGCRVKELCQLQAKHVINEENITAIYIERGKTDAATRVIPLTDELGERVYALANSMDENEFLLGLNEKDASRWFSRIKTAHVSTDSAKTLHSSRAMFATAMQRANVDELKAAAIVGHKRGNTMTYGYYSRGYTLLQLKEAYDHCVDHLVW